MEGVKYYATEPHLLGKFFLRLERDFDRHVDYYMYEPQAQAFLENCDEAHDYFDVSGVCGVLKMDNGTFSLCNCVYSAGISLLSWMD